MLGTCGSARDRRTAGSLGIAVALARDEDTSWSRARAAAPARPAVAPHGPQPRPTRTNRRHRRDTQRKHTREPDTIGQQRWNRATSAGQVSRVRSLDRRQMGWPGSPGRGPSFARRPRGNASEAGANRVLASTSASACRPARRPRLGEIREDPRPATAHREPPRRPAASWPPDSSGGRGLICSRRSREPRLGGLGVRTVIAPLRAERREGSAPACSRSRSRREAYSGRPEIWLRRVGYQEESSALLRRSEAPARRRFGPSGIPTRSWAAGGGRRRGAPRGFDAATGLSSACPSESRGGPAGTLRPHSSHRVVAAHRVKEWLAAASTPALRTPAESGRARSTC